MSDLAPSPSRCEWCDGNGRAVIYGVTVACACRPFDHLQPADEVRVASATAAS